MEADSKKGNVGLSSEDEKSVRQAIIDAELKTSGEIRVHIEENCRVDVLDRAAYVFEKLKMHKTKFRNGALFYLSMNDHKFAVIGDAGINAVVEDNFWEEVRDKLAVYFANGQFADGLVHGIKLTGERLKRYFPYPDDDINELPDDISYEKFPKTD
ncbi:MAG: TPM domain-containing protein [Bacteroidales bacterium]|nr:TPM domain-containing protein [Bacteroidota bacterium]HNY59542.1 TPM domain-containing protein [Bacteroidales bacterium]HOF80670.1 TPM domain-containing protein [Bacteroidales bacterium]HOR76013.1 TPM domain-containing protein [Bacteroidales bacterium]HPX33485.1 TPM domain-containing protein [Bacteroidales bacterium]